MYCYDARQGIYAAESISDFRRNISEITPPKNSKKVFIHFSDVKLQKVVVNGIVYPEAFVMSDDTGAEIAGFPKRNQEKSCISDCGFVFPSVLAAYFPDSEQKALVRTTIVYASEETKGISFDSTSFLGSSLDDVFDLG